jgi:hypothetical protein
MKRGSKKSVGLNSTRKKRASKVVCKKQTLKKYTNRPSPPFGAALCIGQRKRGNDGKMYISKAGVNYGSAKWVKL